MSPDPGAGLPKRVIEQVSKVPRDDVGTPYGRCRPKALMGVVALAVLLGACAATRPAASPASPKTSTTTPASPAVTTTTVTSPNDVSAADPCGHSMAADYRHVLWIWMENESYGAVIGAPDAPYQTALATECGLAANYSAISHPSLPNYLAATGGSTFGISDDGDPSTHPLAAPSLFSQVQAAGLQWAGYDESMPGNCVLTGQGLYAPRHNPAVYYTTLRASCLLHDVPLGTLTSGPLVEALASGDLPSFSFVTPNLCDDAHSCPVSSGDRWLAQFVPTILDSAPYKAGQLVVFVTYDEGTTDNHVPTTVIAPTVPSSTVSHTAFSHYSLLLTTEQLLSLPPLGEAAAAASMRSDFHL